MNEEYLWDKSGEPDPEVQQLEEILGTLRYQPRPLEIPKQLGGERRRWYLPALAVAAAVALVIVATGLWLRIQKQQTNGQSQAAKSGVPSEIKEAPKPVVPPEEQAIQQDKKMDSPRHRTNSGNTLATNVRRVKNARDAGLSAKEREEALAAKQQLMIALRLASEKLNLAQRRTQNSSPSNIIRNQHKTG